MNEKKQKLIEEATKEFRQNIRSESWLINATIGIIDFATFVDYGNGLCVPAEFSIARGTLRGGLDNVYSQIIGVNPCNPR